MFAGGARSARSDALCATLYAGCVGDAGGDALCALCTLEVMGGGLCLLEVLEVPEMMRCVQLCMLVCRGCRRRCVVCSLYAGGYGG